MTDAGVSAFKGANLKTGALGQFTEAVRQGVVPVGSWLLLESLDRFTRQAVNKAAYELLSLVNSGIVVVTLNNNTIYRSEDFDGTEGLVNLLGALIAMQGHHQEQLTKGKRITAAWQNKFDLAKSGQHLLTSRIPFWLDIVDGVMIPNDKATTIQMIYSLRAEGHGGVYIANRLTEMGIQTPYGFKTVWGPTTIKRLLDTDTAAGILTRKTGEQIPGYYPAVISESTYQAVKALRGQGSTKGGNTATHPLVGLVKHSCGASMRRVNKGDGYPVFTCISCRKSVGMNKAVGLFRDALFQSQFVPAPTSLGEGTATLEADLDGIAMEIEEAYLTWRKVKTLASKTSYEQLLSEAAELKAKIQGIKSTNTEILATLEEQRIKESMGDSRVFRQVLKAATTDHDLREWVFSFISGRVVRLEAF
jgi:hypothetical protein